MMMYSQSSSIIHHYRHLHLTCYSYSVPPRLYRSTWRSFRATLTSRSTFRWTKNVMLVKSYRTQCTCKFDQNKQGRVRALTKWENDGECEGVVAPEDAIDYIKWLLTTMGDGRISVSPYDTAWVALIADNDEVNGHGSIPHFTSSLEWIANNQLSDGSWGESCVFSAYDRLVNTLACVIALETWDLHPSKTETGIKFIKENMWKLENADAENMTCGFEVVFPVLLEKARNLGMDLPYGSPVLKQIYARRDLKMTRIPIKVMHTVHTSLLYSLEGINKDDLDWEKLLKLQAPPGSFFTSPASSAYAVIETRDENSLRYLEEIVAKFNGGAPNVYPVNLFTRTFAIDRIQRLGISHYFQPEIKQCLDYVHSYWTKSGISHAKDTILCDIDCTAMGFRLLRLHGYNMSPDVFRNFKEGDEFCCYQGQVNETPSTIFNLYRASQVLFPGEKILEDVNNFSYMFLKERLDNDQLLDKWIILKDLAAEVRYGIEVPWYASLPRVETRFYIEQYGGADDIWIGKSLYRMPEISNNAYLELARSDFNKFQAQHQVEWSIIVKWYEEYNLEEVGISRNIVLLAYFLATANIFQSEQMIERFAWTKAVVICKVIKSYLWGKAISSPETRITFIKEFKNAQFGHNAIKSSSVLKVLVDFLDQLSKDSFKRLGRDIRNQLHDAWEMWLNNNNNNNNGGEASDYLQGDAGLIVITLNLCAGTVDSLDILSHIEFKRLSYLTNKICHKLKVHRHQNKKAIDDQNNDDVVHQVDYMDENIGKDMEIESEFQELVQLVYQSSNTDDGIITQDIKQTFLQVAKTFYYKAYISQETIDLHISKLLFQPAI